MADKELLEREVFGGSDSELSSEDEAPERQERAEVSRRSPGLEDAESSAGSGDDYREKHAKRKKRIPRRTEEGEDVRGKAKKRKRKPQLEEPDFDSLPPEQAKKLRLQMQIDAIVKQKRVHRPKKRKDTEEEVLDRFADEEVSQLREDMLRAAAEDDEANRDKLPATAKLRLLPRVKEVIQKSSLSQSIIDNNLLEGVRRWLEPLPDRSLPALNIQTFFFNQLAKMDIGTDSLKESGLGRIVLFYTKCKRVTAPISRQANELVSAWSRPIIKRSSSYRDRLIPTAPENGLDGFGTGTGNLSGRAVERLNVILARAKENDKNKVRKNAVTIPTRDLASYTVAPRENAGVMRANVSVDQDVERRKKNAERLRSLTRKVNLKP